MVHFQIRRDSKIYMYMLRKQSCCSSISIKSQSVVRVSGFNTDVDHCYLIPHLSPSPADLCIETELRMLATSD